jgi:hypothetical protein
MGPISRAAFLMYTFVLTGDVVLPEGRTQDLGSRVLGFNKVGYAVINRGE